MFNPQCLGMPHPTKQQNKIETHVTWIYDGGEKVSGGRRSAIGADGTASLSVVIKSIKPPNSFPTSLAVTDSFPQPFIQYLEVSIVI